MKKLHELNQLQLYIWSQNSWQPLPRRILLPKSGGSRVLELLAEIGHSIVTSKVKTTQATACSLCREETVGLEVRHFPWYKLPWTPYYSSESQQPAEWMLIASFQIETSTHVNRGRFHCKKKTHIWCLFRGQTSSFKVRASKNY